MHQVHQMWAVADEEASAIASGTIDLVAFAGDGPVGVARDYGAVGGGLGPDCDVIALHATCVLFVSKGRTLDDWAKGDKSDVSLNDVGMLCSNSKHAA